VQPGRVALGVSRDARNYAEAGWLPRPPIKPVEAPRPHAGRACRDPRAHTSPAPVETPPTYVGRALRDPATHTLVEPVETRLNSPVGRDHGTHRAPQNEDVRR
jgi:hypothetical protein